MKMLELQLLSKPSTVGVNAELIVAIEPYDNGYSIGTKISLQNGQEFIVNNSAANIIKIVSKMCERGEHEKRFHTGPM